MLGANSLGQITINNLYGLNKLTMNSLLLLHSRPGEVGYRSFLNYPPRSYAIFFVITRSLVNDWRSVLIPNWRSFIIKSESPLRLRSGMCPEPHFSQGRGQLPPLDSCLKNHRHNWLKICRQRYQAASRRLTMSWMARSAL